MENYFQEKCEKMEVLGCPCERTRKEKRRKGIGKFE
jgi:hypothetical protein